MQSLSSGPVRKDEPYSHLATIYDYVMSHVDYKRWASYIDHLLLRAHIAADEILDISCGTASLGWHLHQLGYGIALFDRSVAMAQQAVHKFRRGGLYVPVWVADMRAFTLKRPYQVAVCSYDSMNYLLKEDDWQKVLSCVSAALSPGGIFVFDVCTELNSLRNFKNYKDRDSGPGFHFTRNSHYSQQDRIQTNEFHISIYKGSKRSYYEVHRQRIYSLEEIMALLAKSHFDMVGMYEDFTVNPASEKSERVHFVLQNRT